MQIDGELARNSTEITECQSFSKKFKRFFYQQPKNMKIGAINPLCSAQNAIKNAEISYSNTLILVEHPIDPKKIFINFFTILIFFHLRIFKYKYKKSTRRICNAILVKFCILFIIKTKFK